MTVRYHDSDEPKPPRPLTREELEAGYCRLADGFTPGQICDPDHDGEGDDVGSSANYNSGGNPLRDMFVYRKQRDENPRAR